MKKHIIITGILLIIVFLIWISTPTTLNKTITNKISLNEVEKVNVEIISIFSRTEKIEIINNERIKELVDRLGSFKVRRVTSSSNSIVFNPDKEGSYYITFYTHEDYFNIGIMDKDYIIIRVDNHEDVLKMVGGNSLEEVYELIIK